MEDVKSYFLDTYALIEIVKENQNYERFKELVNFSSYMNLLELHYIISRNFDSKKADFLIDKLKSVLLKVEVKDILEASKFKLKHAKKKFSYIDCLGNAMALNRNIKFLTGDNEFKDLNNVEFVK